MNQDLFVACLAEPTRHTLLQHLHAGQCSVSELVEATGHSQSNISHHLRQLRDCGLVVFERDGKQNRYRLAHESVATVLTAIQGAAQHLPQCEACA